MTTIGDTAGATFEAAWNEWHTDRERYYGDPLGWVSLTGLYWLTDEFDTVADLPGRWRADVDAVVRRGNRRNRTARTGGGCTRFTRRRRGSPYRGDPPNRLCGITGARSEFSAPGRLQRHPGLPTQRAVARRWHVHAIRTVEGRHNGCRRRRTRAPPQRCGRHRLRNSRRRTPVGRIRPSVGRAACPVHRCHQRRDDISCLPITFRRRSRRRRERDARTSTGRRTCRARSPTTRHARWHLPRTDCPSRSRPGRRTRGESGAICEVLNPARF